MSFLLSALAKAEVPWKQDRKSQLHSRYNWIWFRQCWKWCRWLCKWLLRQTLACDRQQNCFQSMGGNEEDRAVPAPTIDESRYSQNPSHRCANITVEFFSKTQRWQCWHYCQLCIPYCHRLHGDLELILATGAAIRKAKDIQFFVHTTVLLIAQQSVNFVLQWASQLAHKSRIRSWQRTQYSQGQQATTELKCVKWHILSHFIQISIGEHWRQSGVTVSLLNWSIGVKEHTSKQVTSIFTSTSIVQASNASIRASKP